MPNRQHATRLRRASRALGGAALVVILGLMSTGSGFAGQAADTAPAGAPLRATPSLPAGPVVATAASNPCASGRPGYWTGFWRWSAVTRRWSWTWVWHRCTGGTS